MSNITSSEATPVKEFNEKHATIGLIGSIVVLTLTALIAVNVITAHLTTLFAFMFFFQIFNLGMSTKSAGTFKFKVAMVTQLSFSVYLIIHSLLNIILA